MDTYGVATDSPSIDRTLSRLPILVGAFALLTGIAFVAAWNLIPARLLAPHSDWLSVKPNMALSLVLGGLCLMIAAKPGPAPDAVEQRGRRRRILVPFLGLAVALIGAATLVEHQAQANLGIDGLVAQASELAPLSLRMPPLAATSLAVLGLGLALTLARGALGHVGRACLALAGICSSIGVIAYLFGAGADLRWPEGQPAMAMPAAIAVLGLTLGAITLKRDGSLFCLATRDDVTGLLVRRLALASVLVPITAGWIRLLGEQAGLYRSGFGLAIMVAFSTAAMLVVVWIAARTLARVEAERLEAMDELRQSETRFRTLLEAAPDGILVVDSEGRIRLLNAQAEALFGYSRDKLLGESIEVLIPERFRPEHPAKRSAFHASPSAAPLGQGPERWARREDGSEFPVEITLSPIEEDGERLVTAIVRDVTSQRLAQRQLGERATALARSNADLEQFAYVASHDLQEPLRAVVSFLQLVERRVGETLDPEALRFVGRSIDAAGRMQALIQDLLAYSRVDRLGQPFALVSLDSVLERALANLKVAIDESGARIVRPEKLPSVRADATQLAQVFQNLIGNAIKFKGERIPEILIGIAADGSEWVISVADNGIGIDPKFFDRIFIIFQRLHSRRHYEGTGIGLSICKKIVERHDGRMWVESQPGGGSRFCFSLTKGKV